MSMNRLMSLVEEIIDDAKTAVLATVNERGQPQLRWITPGTIGDRPGFLYMITAHDFAKVKQAKNHPAASMLLQTRLLDKILHLQGELAVLENPILRSETLERVSSRLTAFWKTGSAERELLVLEFTISSAVLYTPQSGAKEEITVNGGGA